MISIDDWVFDHLSRPGPMLPHDWTPDTSLLARGDEEKNAVRMVAKELARLRGEQSVLAWYWYIGMAVTWLADQSDDDTLAAWRASGPELQPTNRR